MNKEIIKKVLEMDDRLNYLDSLERKEVEDEL